MRKIYLLLSHMLFESCYNRTALNGNNLHIEERAAKFLILGILKKDLIRGGGKVVNVLLDSKNFKLGIRLFLCTEDQSPYDLYVNIDFSEAGVDGIYTGYDNRLGFNEWY